MRKIKTLISFCKYPCIHKKQYTLSFSGTPVPFFRGKYNKTKLFTKRVQHTKINTEVIIQR